MPLYLVKSYLSVGILLLAAFAVFTMFEVFGRAEKKYNIEALKKLHRANGIIYVLLFLAIAYLCAGAVIKTNAEPSARGAIHTLIALAILALLIIKVLFVRIYRLFYSQAKAIGVALAVLSFMMVGISGGYYILMTKSGSKALAKAEPPKMPAEMPAVKLRTDPESVSKGRELYESKCYSCHDPLSEKTIIGPGHKGILKNPLLPVSKRPSTPQNIALQIRKPFDKMPAFQYLSDDEMQNILAYLGTL